MAAALLVLALAAAAPCPEAPCVCADAGARLVCRAADLQALPPLHDKLVALDVSNNNISVLPPGALESAIALRDLNLSANRLELSGALSGASLARLWLDGCGLKRLPPALAPRLHYLSADDNSLSELEGGVFAGARSLRVLRLARNRLRAVPAAALAHTTRLQALNLAGNQISELTSASLPPLPSLHTL
ncbi:leucine-rich repeats and immunoglobulin-like domains protein 1 [Aricia agestis]|uniref:leucine-rich repeats and immunoglobulin-like domains protein 1 n=1 Tax=Aricia agestis TaxID=91739 RepID=UPI001C209D38|nr:leucine-rich repeats and immunoglobulin-like domains protein 1 [Aricia agestis]